MRMSGCVRGTCGEGRDKYFFALAFLPAVPPFFSTFISPHLRFPQDPLPENRSAAENSAGKSGKTFFAFAGLPAIPAFKTGRKRQAFESPLSAGNRKSHRKLRTRVFLRKSLSRRSIRIGTEPHFRRRAFPTSILLPTLPNLSDTAHSEYPHKTFSQKKD